MYQIDEYNTVSPTSATAGLLCRRWRTIRGMRAGGVQHEYFTARGGLDQYARWAVFVAPRRRLGRLDNSQRMWRNWEVRDERGRPALTPDADQKTRKTRHPSIGRRFYAPFQIRSGEAVAWIPGTPRVRDSGDPAPAIFFNTLWARIRRSRILIKKKKKPGRLGLSNFFASPEFSQRELLPADFSRTDCSVADFSESVYERGARVPAARLGARNAFFRRPGGCTTFFERRPPMT